MGGIGNQFKDVRIFKNRIFNLIQNFMAGIKLKAQGLGEGTLRVPPIKGNPRQAARQRWQEEDSFQQQAEGG